MEGLLYEDGNYYDGDRCWVRGMRLTAARMAETYYYRLHTQAHFGQRRLIKIIVPNCSVYEITGRGSSPGGYEFSGGGASSHIGPLSILACSLELFWDRQSKEPLVWSVPQIALVVPIQYLEMKQVSSRRLRMRWVQSAGQRGRGAGGLS